MKLRIGISTQAEARGAVAEAARAATSHCASPALALIFATFEYGADDLVAAARETLGELPCVGCASPAILHDREVIRRGIAVAVVDSDRIRVGIGVGDLVSANARAAGRKAALEALAGMPLPPVDRSRALILFGNASAGDVAEALNGALSAAGAGIVWSGGGVGDGEQGARGTIFAKGAALRDHVVAVVLDGHARVGASVQHGFQPTGPAAMVTAASGSVVQRLEHQPAISIYRSAAGEGGESMDPETFAAFAPTHPLGIPQADGECLVRDPISVHEDGSIQLVASIPDGALVRVMEGTPDMLVSAARVAASMARKDARGTLGGALVFDCVSRFMMLGDRLGDELAACHEALGEAVPLIGCLTTGEVGAFGARIPQFHNKTMVVLGLPA